MDSELVNRNSITENPVSSAHGVVSNKLTGSYLTDNRRLSVAQKKAAAGSNGIDITRADISSGKSSAVHKPSGFFLADNRVKGSDQNKTAKTLPPESKFPPNSISASGRGLPLQLKVNIEHLSGIAMDGVNVHYNSAEPTSLQAHAYAKGTEIHVAPGQEKHLPHEAWHVVQQKQGRVKPNLGTKSGVHINDDPQLENEADTMGRKASQPLSMKGSADIAKPHQIQIPADAVQKMSAVIQLKIHNKKTKQKVRAYFSKQGIEKAVLGPLLEAAFENTTNRPDAIRYVEERLKHPHPLPPPANALVQPVNEVKEDALAPDAVQVAKPFLPINDEKEEPISEKDKISGKQKETADLHDDSSSSSAKRSEINTDSVKSDFQSLVPALQPPPKEDTIYNEWKKLNNSKFYAKTRELLKTARDPKEKNQKLAVRKLDELITGYKQFEKIKALVDGYVRVKATKAPEASTGTGLDELFKTSETMKYLELSYRPPVNTVSIAKYKGKNFDWMDAQQQIRLSTEFIVWAADLVGGISGHTGTFQTKYQGQWATKKQALMHELRDKAIANRTTPANGIIEALSTHLRVTANVDEFTNIILKDPEASETLTTSGRSITQIGEVLTSQLGVHRDMLKDFHDYLEKNTENAPGHSPKKGKQGTDKYIPNSPKQSPDKTHEIDEKSGKVEGNPLPALFSQKRLKYGKSAIPIPKKPQSPALVNAIASITRDFGKNVSQSIKNAAKRKVKAHIKSQNKQSADASEVINADQMMGKVFLRRLEELKEGKSDKVKKAISSIIKTLTDELEAEA